ncbi:MAG: UDP-N-acetylmuramoyl-L-alanyl-D-glutamate--2,6-diaminopimelate ligase, partial [Acidobacteriota bacterium]|nr:UDP-N-acetylmuramoyl-L-alanyl-D-glutamate--2,6-diaminopimelate ligase [Acidobacteriota bacterium]
MPERKMTLEALTRDAQVVELSGDRNLEIKGLAYDSRLTTPSSLFFAIEGEAADGHRFIEAALDKGAAGVVSERPGPPNFPHAWVRVPRIRRALSELGRNFYGHPDSRLKLTGITGTNG